SEDEEAGDDNPDVFVEAYVNGYKSKKPFMKTDAVDGDLEPEWGEEGTVRLENNDVIHFMVWDKDLSNHDLIGECKTKKIKSVKEGTVTLKCGQVKELVIKINKK
ncbi:MAG: hypothetical protein JXX29_09715, partial [Deltaproteobacteria bacterium]|nr:hypothetical protein [Deltaproteobacteria bacterium]